MVIWVIIILEDKEKKGLSTMYKVPIENVPELKTKIEKLNRKATKIGCPQVEVYMTGAHDEIDTKTKKVQRYIHIEVEGERPVINGWKFVATLQHVTEENRNIVRVVPGEVLDEGYRTAKPVCHHCNTIRYRKDTYVVQHIETGEYKQVGRNCLADFFEGGVQPQQYAAWAQMLHDAEEAASASTTKRNSQSDLIWADAFLQACAEAALRFGFVSKATARRAYEERDQHIDTTAQVALHILYPGEFTPEKYRDIEISPAAEELVRKAMEWVDTWKDNDELNDYLYNLSVVAKMTAITYRETGLLASLIGAYLREVEGQQQQRVKQEKKPGFNKHYGKVGEKVELVLKVNKVTTREGTFGETHVHQFEDEEGHEFTWFATNKMLPELKWFKLTATIKAHDEYKGYKKTVITRCNNIQQLEI